MNEVVNRLIALKFLIIEQRVKRRRIVNELQPGVNEINIQQSREGFFKITFQPGNQDHKDFLQKYQIVYPGEII